MTPRRLMTLLVMGLAVLCLTAPAWAHPGHGAPGLDGFHAPDQSTPESTGTAESWDALRRHAPESAALVVAALALLTTVPHRRRVLALAVVLLLSMLSLEGVLHAALHLHHARHADGLAIGTSSALQAAAVPDPDNPTATPAVLLSEVVERYIAPGPEVAVAASRGRAPPVFPA